MHNWNLSRQRNQLLYPARDYVSPLLANRITETEPTVCMEDGTFPRWTAQVGAEEARLTDDEEVGFEKTECEASDMSVVSPQFSAQPLTTHDVTPSATRRTTLMSVSSASALPLVLG